LYNPKIIKIFEDVKFIFTIKKANTKIKYYNSNDFHITIPIILFKKSKSNFIKELTIYMIIKKSNSNLAYPIHE